MRNHLENRFRGYVLLSIKSEKIQRFFHLCAFRGLTLWNVECAAQDYKACVSTVDFKKLQPICRKTNTRVHILRKFGLPFFFSRNRKRKAFFLGIFLCMALLYGLSRHIWQIQITGNQANTTPVILSYLDELEVFQGVQKNKLNCGKISASIRQEFPNITWVSTKIEGTKLRITIQENDVQGGMVKEEGQPCDLVAAHSGKIVSMVTREGVPVKREGETCKKGEVLVSGRVEIKNDSQEVVRYEYVAADADVKIQYELSYKDTFPLKYQERVYQEKTKKRYGLRWGDWRLALGGGLAPQGHQDVVTELLQCPLTGGFPNPIYLERQRLRSYRVVTRFYTQKEAKEKAVQRLQNTYEKLLEEGIEISQNKVKTTVDEKSCVSEGKLVVNSSTGKTVAIEDLSQPEIPKIEAGQEEQ